MISLSVNCHSNFSITILSHHLSIALSFSLYICLSPDIRICLSLILSFSLIISPHTLSLISQFPCLSISDRLYSLYLGVSPNLSPRSFFSPISQYICVSLFRCIQDSNPNRFFEVRVYGGIELYTTTYNYIK